MLGALSGKIDIALVSSITNAKRNPVEPHNIHKDRRDSMLERVEKTTGPRVVNSLIGGPKVVAISNDPNSQTALSPAEARLAHRLATMSVEEREKAINTLKEINAYIDRQEMDVTERYAAQFREQALKEIGISEEELEAMPDEARGELERKVRDIIKRLMAEKAREEEEKAFQTVSADTKSRRQA